MTAEFHLAAFPGIVCAGVVSHCHGSLGYLNRTEPLLMSLAQPCFSCCDKCAVKEVCGPPTQVLPLFCLNRPHYRSGVHCSSFIDISLALSLVSWPLWRCVQLRLHFIWLMGPLASLARLFLESPSRGWGEGNEEEVQRWMKRTC